MHRWSAPEMEGLAIERERLRVKSVISDQKPFPHTRERRAKGWEDQPAMPGPSSAAAAGALL